MGQIQFVDLDHLVSKKHIYRKFLAVFDFSIFEQILLKTGKKDNGGYGSERLFKCILLQHLEDLSDRELERFFQENLAAKWFCGFSINEKTPDHSCFGKFRERLGVEKLQEMFEALRDQLKAEGLMNEFFSVVDASHLITKANLWEERDKAKKLKYQKLNNEVLPEVACDQEARIGCKGKNKFWYGYKVTRCIDMQSGLINRTDLSGANIHDVRTLERVAPSRGAVYTDKGFCSSLLEKRLKKEGIVLRAIKKNNMKRKDFDFDRYISKWRSPFERMFSQTPKRARFRGKEKNLFAEVFECINFNLKRLVVLKEESLAF